MRVMPRFVILEHDHPHWHLDFMLEVGPVLRTWRLDAIPQPNECVNAQPIGDHRLAYLDYEGPVSGGRGAVKRWDAGTFAVVESSADRWIVDLAGVRLIGRAVLERRDQSWTLTFHGTEMGKPGSKD